MLSRPPDHLGKRSKRGKMFPIQPSTSTPKEGRENIPTSDDDIAVNGVSDSAFKADSNPAVKVMRA